MPTRKHRLSDLGTDVLVRILRHIPFEQYRKELPLVSKYWRRVLREPEVWHGRMSLTFSSLKAEHLGRSIAWILRRTLDEGHAGVCLGLKVLSAKTCTAIQEVSFLLTECSYFESYYHWVFPTAILAITQLASLKITGCAADIPNGISALSHLTSLEYWSQVRCPPQRLSCLRALKLLTISLYVDEEDANDRRIEGVACLPSLEQLSFDCRLRIPAELYALQLTSLKLDFKDPDADLAEAMVEENLPPICQASITDYDVQNLGRLLGGKPPLAWESPSQNASGPEWRHRLKAPLPPMAASLQSLELGLGDNAGTATRRYLNHLKFLSFPYNEELTELPNLRIHAPCLEALSLLYMGIEHFDVDDLARHPSLKSVSVDTQTYVMGVTPDSRRLCPQPGMLAILQLLAAIVARHACQPDFPLIVEYEDVK